MTKEIYCTRKIEFDAAHRVIGHENKCKYLHGHRYVLEVTFSAPNLDSLGRVIDFGELKNIIKEWIDDNLDHTTILSTEDNQLGLAISQLTNQKIYYLGANPTAENIATHLFVDIFPELFKNHPAKLNQVLLYETPNCHVVIK